MVSASSVPLAAVIGGIPTTSMILAIIALSNIEVGAKIEASLQNFAAGLIIAAVAGELFPVMLDSSKNPSYIGISVGFVIGLATIYGLEAIIGYLEGIDERTDETPNPMNTLVKTFPRGSDDEADSPDRGQYELTRFVDVEAGFEDEEVARASRAISAPEHRHHIMEHLHELMQAITEMETKSSMLTISDLTVRQTEDIAEHIDEQVHMLQYKLDHCRRLLEGSETDQFNTLSSSTWVTEERKVNIRKGLTGLRFTVEHLLEHINEQTIDKSVLQEMRIHMDYMDKQINFFHENIEKVSQKWKRRYHQLPPTQEGDTLPLGLVLPVTMDCFVDGFLIGISTAINFKAGVVLGAANCLEMGFLGMAYAARLKKCTATPFRIRMLALYGPPLLMTFSAVLGALVGDATRASPAIFIALVAFGSVALLFLVCNELLIEAREAQGEDERWWISIMVFVGIYIVLMVDHAI